MSCIFGNDNCQPTCPKYSICMYNSVQQQLSEINSQITFILQYLTNLTANNEDMKTEIDNANKNIEDLVSSVILILNDSETKQKHKESKQ